ncbi:MAG: NUDIX hydrolase [Oscillospiraceae bacterium]|nr:NUDIX hydrolase [Oscillospiraceae bacterium]
MTEKPVVGRENTDTLLDTRFIKVYDLRYAPGRHYYDASRREKEELVALKSDTEFRTMAPDAATCILILRSEREGDRLFLQYEYRYPAGRLLLSPPAGLIDREDAGKEDAVILTAKREIQEETGIKVRDTDRVFEINPLVFSSPGLTDECNALVCAVVSSDGEGELSQEGAEGSEYFDGYVLLSEEDARRILREGRDDRGNFYSVYTWAALIYFVSGMWRE